MGRNPKKGVDYYPHDVHASGGPTLFTVQERFGNDGYAFWFKLLEHLGTKETLSMDCNNVSDWLFFVAKAKVSEEKAVQILDLLASIEAIDPELWKVKIVWSDNFAERLADVYKKRGTEKPRRPDFCDRNNSEGDVPGGEKPKGGKKGSRKKSEENPDEKPPKTAFAEYVSMKQAEYDKLVSEFGEPATKKMVEVLNNYKGSSGKKYQSDYLAIRNWVIDRVKKEHPRLFECRAEPGGNPYAGY